MCVLCVGVPSVVCLCAMYGCPGYECVCVCAMYGRPVCHLSVCYVWVACI